MKPIDPSDLPLLHQLRRTLLRQILQETDVARIRRLRAGLHNVNALLEENAAAAARGVGIPTITAHRISSTN